MTLSKFILDADWKSGIEFFSPNENISAVSDRKYKQYLVNKGCDGGGSMLYHATKLNAPAAVVKLLLEYGEDSIIFRTGKSGFTALHNACTSQVPDLELIQLLLEKGGKELTLIQGRNYVTALHRACSSKTPKSQLVRMIANVGGKELVLMKNKDDSTALHFLCRGDNPSIAVALILIDIGGYNILLQKNKNGKTAYDVLIQNHRKWEDVAEFLKQQEESLAGLEVVPPGNTSNSVDRPWNHSEERIANFTRRTSISCDAPATNRPTDASTISSHPSSVSTTPSLQSESFAAVAAAATKTTTPPPTAALFDADATVIQSHPDASTTNKWMKSVGFLKHENEEWKQRYAQLLNDKKKMEHDFEKAIIEAQMDLGSKLFELKLENDELVKENSQMFQESIKLKHELRAAQHEIQELKREKEDLKWTTLNCVPKQPFDVNSMTRTTSFLSKRLVKLNGSPSPSPASIRSVHVAPDEMKRLKELFSTDLDLFQ